MNTNMSAAKNVIGGKYRKINVIGRGSFGEIYRGLNIEDGSEVAIKMESRKDEPQQLLYEAKIYKTLGNMTGLPEIYYYGPEENHNVMVMQLLGHSLEDLFNICNRHFSLKTVLLLSYQMLLRLECVHRAHIIHRDVKPDNFLMGVGEETHNLFLIDFGLAKLYYERNRGKHISFLSDRDLIGTVRYASINAQKRCEQSRRDDLESMSYCIIYFNLGKLPWQGLNSKTVRQKFEKILEMKTSMRIEQLCQGLPNEFGNFLSYCRSLRFEQTPDYKYLRQLIVMLFKNLKYEYDNKYDWTLIHRKAGSTTGGALTANQTEVQPEPRAGEHEDEQTESEPEHKLVSMKTNRQSPSQSQSQ